MKILDILKLTDEERSAGVWLSGKYGEGECKWWGADEFREQSFWKDGKRHGICKRWNRRGRLHFHDRWKNGRLVQDFLQKRKGRG